MVKRFSRAAAGLLALAMILSVFLFLAPSADAASYSSIDFSSGVLNSRINQKVYGDCAVVSMCTIEAYMNGATTSSQKDTVYNAVVNANGAQAYAYWGRVGYYTASLNWTTIYNQLKNGIPSIIHRTGSSGEHWAVVAGYNGSSSSLEWNKFIVVDVYLGTGGVDIKSSGTWGSGCTIDRMAIRSSGMSISIAPADLGTDFYGLILNTAAWKPITWGSDGYVTMQTEIGYASQVWKFTRQSDGSYTIANALNGRLLEITSNASGSRVSATSASCTGTHQHWVIYQYAGGYVIQSKLAPSVVLDMSNNDSTNGTPVLTYNRNNTGAQIWSVYKADDVQLKAPTLSAAVDDEGAVKFTWGQVYGESSFRVNVYYNGTLSWYEDNVTSGYTLTNLPNGTYTAEVVAKNYFLSKTSSQISFTVTTACDHSWTSKVTPATCTEPAVTTYSCPLCGESKTEKAELNWSDWSADYPSSDTGAIRVQYKEQYRYSDLVPAWSTGETKTITYVKSWPSGFNKSSSYYSTYNKTPVTTSTTAAQKITVTSEEIVGYINWHWCRGTYAYGPINRAIADCCEGEFTAFHAYYGTAVGSDYDANGSYGGGAKYLYNAGCCTDAYWYFQIPVYKQTYTVQTLQNSGDTWGSWSDWSDTEATASSTRKVETRRLFRYITEGLADHTWDEGTVTTAPTAATTGVKTHHCTICGAEGTSTIPVLGSGSSDTSQRQEGEGTQNPFVDVTDQKKYYYEPVLWAYSNGITSGTDATHFAPGNDCNRQQMVMFLWRYAGQPDVGNVANPFTDVSESSRFYKAIMWAYYNGITTGTTDTTFSPTAYCTRQQMVMFLYRMAGTPAVSGVSNPFTDVSSGSRFYNAILWAYSTGVTKGVTATTFVGTDTCTRGQFVTFLYRAVN